MSVKIVFLALTLLILLAVGAYTVQVLREPKIPADEKILSGAKDEISSHGLLTQASQTGEMWWGEEGERFILNTSARTFVTEIGLTDNEMRQYVTSQEIRVYEHPQLNQVYNWLDTYFKENDLSQNSHNSITAKVGLSWSDYAVAYQRGILKCTVTTHNEVTTSTNAESGVQSHFIEIITACEDDLTSAKEEQTKFFKDLDLEDTDVGVEVIARLGNVLNLGIFFRNSESAYKVIALDKDGSLTKIYDSRPDGELPSCVEMQKYQIPQAIYWKCQ